MPKDLLKMLGNEMVLLQMGDETEEEIERANEIASGMFDGLNVADNENKVIFMGICRFLKGYTASADFPEGIDLLDLMFYYTNNHLKFKEV